MKISVSILNIKDDLSKIEELELSSADYIHLDIMDGKFVPNITEMSRVYHKPLDVHLMVQDVKKYVNEYQQLNPQYLTFHYEAVDNPKDIIDYIHSLNIKAGISISPKTPVNTIIPYLNEIDLVLVMSVNPGAGGQPFISTTTSKINELYDLRTKNLYNYEIQVDGGINETTISLVEKADIAVVGSYVTNSSNFEEKIQKIKQGI